MAVVSAGDMVCIPSSSSDPSGESFDLHITPVPEPNLPRHHPRILSCLVPIVSSPEVSVIVFHQSAQVQEGKIEHASGLVDDSIQSQGVRAHGVVVLQLVHVLQY